MKTSDENPAPLIRLGVISGIVWLLTTTTYIILVYIFHDLEKGSLAYDIIVAYGALTLGIAGMLAGDIHSLNPALFLLGMAAQCLVIFVILWTFWHLKRWLQK